MSVDWQDEVCTDCGHYRAEHRVTQECECWVLGVLSGWRVCRCEAYTGATS